MCGKNIVIIPFAILIMGCTFPLFSGGGTEDSGSAVHINDDGHAAQGADVVAYLSLDSGDAAVLGSEEYSHSWKGANWIFSSQENLDTFKANPEMYEPQYGGYCAWAMARNKLATIDPDMWTITDSRLYLNYDQSVQDKWLSDMNDEIANADGYWPAWEEKLTSPQWAYARFTPPVCPVIH